MREYWRYHRWELPLVLLAAATLVLTFSQGFYIPDWAADSFPLTATVCLAALLYCYLGGYNRKTMILFSLGFILLTALAFLGLRLNGVVIVDQEDSPTAIYLYWLAAPLIAALTYLLSRTRAGMALLFLWGGFQFALNVFLEFEARLWWLAVFLLALTTLYPLRTYRIQSAAGATRQPAFGRFAAAALLTALVGLGLGCGLFFAVIRPLDPPTADVSFFTRYLSYDVLERVGVARQYPIPDESISTPQPEPNPTPDRQEPESDDGQAPAEQTPPPYLGSSGVDDQTALDSVSYAAKLTPYLAAALIALLTLTLLLPVLRRRRRRQVLTRLRRGGGREQMVALYRFYLNKFRQLGFPRLPAQTETEYANACGRQLLPYTEGSVDLAALTEHYLAARYGRAEIPESVCDACAGLYPVLLENYRRLRGPFRYLLHYFTL